MTVPGFVLFHNLQNLMPELTDSETIEARLDAGKTAMQKVAQRVRMACRRFKDPSQQGAAYSGATDENDADFDFDQAVGSIPFLSTNVRTKVAAICIGDPDWHIEMQQEQGDQIGAGGDDLGLLPDDAQNVVKLLFRHLWDTYHWQRLTKRGALLRTISFKGCVAYLWDDARGAVLEHVNAWDLIIDPHVTDWDDLRWGGRMINMPPDEAKKRWPDKAEFFEQSNKDGSAAQKRNAIKLKLYWDKTTEAVFFEDKPLEVGPNHYGKVPLLFLHGDINPLSPYDTGDYDTCTGLEQQAQRSIDSINNKATHGGALNLYNPDSFDKAGRDQLQTGKTNGYIAVDGGDFANALYRVPAEQVSDAELKSLDAMRQSLDETTAVNSYMRGTASGAHFATEVATVVNQSGAVGQMARQDYEDWLNKIAMAVKDLFIQFFKPQSQEELMLVLALQDVARIRVIESSTSYKDPALTQQQKRQLWLDAVQMATAGAPVNVMLFWEDYLRSCSIRDVKRYELAPPPAAPPQPGIPPNVTVGDATGAAPTGGMPVNQSPLAPQQPAAPVVGA